MIRYFLKTALRNLMQNKVYASISIIGFAISFAICIVIALYVQYEYSFDTCFTNHERIYKVIDQTKDKNKSRFDYDVNELFADKIPEVEQACPIFMHYGWKNTVKQGDNTIYFEDLVCTTNSFFEMFGITDIKGLPASFQNDFQNVVITESIARQLFPNGNALGKNIRVMDEFDVNVAAVLPNFPGHSTFKGEVIMNSTNPEYRFSSNCNNGDCYNPSHHFIMLNDNNKKEVVEAKINALLSAEDTRVDKITMQSLTDIYLNRNISDNQNAQGNIVFIRLLIVIGLLILIISVINYVNFNNSVQFTRLRMVGIQKSVGAYNKQLIIYQLTEVLLWISSAILLALGIVYIGIPYFSILFEAHLSFANLFSPTIFLSIVLVFFLIVAISSVSPLIILFKGNVAKLLKNSISKTGKRKGETLLTSFQLGISIILVIGILMIQKQIKYVKHKDLGFDKEQLLLVNTPYYFKNQETLKSELLKHSNIKSISYSRGGPGKIYSTMGCGLDDNYFDIRCISVDTTFLKTFNINLANGRNYLPSDYDKACIINKEAYNRYGWKNLENKRFMNGRRGGYEVIGVVEDFHIASLYKKIEPVALIYDIESTSIVNIRLAGGDIGSTMDYIEKTWTSVSNNMPFEYQFYDTYFDSMYKKEETLAKNVSLFAFIALLLTVLGIFGQIFHLSILKTKEIGIRKVNGAKVLEILAMFNSNFVKWVLIAFSVSLPLAWYLIQLWLSSFSYQTSMDIWIFVAGGMAVLVITLLTVTLQSWSAARRNPVEALRYE